LEGTSSGLEQKNASVTLNQAGNSSTLLEGTSSGLEQKKTSVLTIDSSNTKEATADNSSATTPLSLILPKRIVPKLFPFIIDNYLPDLINGAHESFINSKSDLIRLFSTYDTPHNHQLLDLYTSKNARYQSLLSDTNLLLSNFKIDNYSEHMLQYINWEKQFSELFYNSNTKLYNDAKNRLKDLSLLLNRLHWAVSLSKPIVMMCNFYFPNYTNCLILCLQTRILCLRSLLQIFQP
jgi:hypothetical protein